MIKTIAGNIINPNFIQKAWAESQVKGNTGNRIWTVVIQLPDTEEQETLIGEYISDMAAEEYIRQEIVSRWG